MDALKLLEDDHTKVKKLMEDIEPTTERGVKTRTELFATIMPAVGRNIARRIVVAIAKSAERKKTQPTTARRKVPTCRTAAGRTSQCPPNRR